MNLTDVQVRNLKWKGSAAGEKYSDGRGMYLLVKESGKYWRKDYRFAGKQKTYAIGVYPQITLAKAREERESVIAILAGGTDPSERRKLAKRSSFLQNANTFEAVAKQWFENWKQDKSPSTVKTCLRRLEHDVLPELGIHSIDSIKTPAIVNIVKAVNARGARGLAERIQNLCSQIFRYAIAHGACENNPAVAVRPSDILPAHRVQNRKRIDTAKLPQLLNDIENYDGSVKTRLALQLMSVVFVRTSELIKAEWTEFDLDNNEWRIPATRMKMPTDHIVPLCPQAISILKNLKAMHLHSKYVFPSRYSLNKHMSNGTLLVALKRMGYGGEMTGHGFRGVASTILHEKGFDHTHIELQLAHMERNRVSAAYNHATYLPQRTRMMEWWGNYLQEQLEMSRFKKAA